MRGQGGVQGGEGGREGRGGGRLTFVFSSTFAPWYSKDFITSQ